MDKPNLADRDQPDIMSHAFSSRSRVDSHNSEQKPYSDDTTDYHTSNKEEFFDTFERQPAENLSSHEQRSQGSNHTGTAESSESSTLIGKRKASPIESTQRAGSFSPAFARLFATKRRRRCSTSPESVKRKADDEGVEDSDRTKRLHVDASNGQTGVKRKVIIKQESPSPDLRDAKRFKQEGPDGADVEDVSAEGEEQGRHFQKGSLGKRLFDCVSYDFLASTPHSSHQKVVFFRLILLSSSLITPPKG